MKALLFTSFAYVILPLVTLYSCFASIYLLDFDDPEFLPYLVQWAPGVFLYYVYVSQLIIGQRLPFLDRIWGFPNQVRRHRGLLIDIMLFDLVLHIVVHLRDGLEKLVLRPDSGMLAVYIAVVFSILLIWVANKVWLRPPADKSSKNQKNVSYAKMHLLHQLFYFIAIAVWYHVFTAGAFRSNLLGQILVSGYLIFALLCKVFMVLLQLTAPVYRLESMETLHENFVRLRLRTTRAAPIGTKAQLGANRRVRLLHYHQPGQYAYFSFAMQDKNGKAYWEQHPFSFAGYAPQDSAEDNSLLTVIVKKRGDFTNRLHELATGETGTRVRVLGPYGNFCLNSVHSPDGVQLVAAGIGITPFLSILEQRAFAAATASPEGGGRLEPLKELPLTLHWFVTEESELVFSDRFRYFKKQLPHLNIKTYVGQSLTHDILLQTLIASAEGRPCVLYCGPGPVVPILRNVMANMHIPRRYFHSELFAM